MVKFIDSERAVARWEICGIVISLPHRRERTNDEMHNIIEAYINAVKNKRYEEDNTDLCIAFKAVGGLPFVKIGYLAMREEFIGMFKYYAELFVAKWIGSNKCIHSKNVGVQYVFEEMLCHEDFEIKYDFMYILDDNVVDSTLFVNIVDDIFIKKWTVIVRDSITQDESLRQITKRIGFAKLYRIAEKMQEEVEKYFRRIAARYTKRREIITMHKIQLFLFGRVLEYGEYDIFWDLLQKIVDAEYNRQCKLFVKENLLQFDMSKDEWVVYRRKGDALVYKRFDFSTIMRPFIKQEIKQYIKHLHSPIISFGDSSLTLIVKAVNIIAENNPSVQCMADIEDVDVQMLYETLERENTANNGKSPIHTMDVFSHMKVFVRFLMSGNSKKVGLPVPKHNLFEKYSFVNSKEYTKNTAIIPDVVMDELVKHSTELSEAFELIFNIYSNTGLRTKEVMLLEEDCIRASRYADTVQLRYKTYKTLKAYKRTGISEYRELPIPKELGDRIQDYIVRTEEYRQESGLPYIFLKKRGNKILLENSSYFSDKVNRLIEKYNICGEDGCLWHFTTRQFRKTIAVTLIENGASVDEVGYWLGHLGRSNTMKYYAEVRKAKLAEMNSKFFKDKFDLIISQEQLTQYSEEERKLLYVDFCMEYRRVELGYCLQKIADGGCNKRNSLYNCVNCTNLCTGKKYLSYWKELLEQQNLTVQKLFDSYEKQNITDYTEYKEYKQETFLQQCYLNIVNAIENAEVQDE